MCPACDKFSQLEIIPRPALILTRLLTCLVIQPRLNVNVSRPIQQCNAPRSPRLDWTSTRFLLLGGDGPWELYSRLIPPDKLT